MPGSLGYGLCHSGTGVNRLLTKARPMARYWRSGTAASLFQLGTGMTFKGSMLYDTDDEFGVRLSDGSTAYFRGDDIVWDAAIGKFTGGSIASIRHYSGGTLNDSLENFTMSAAGLQALLEGATSITAVQAALLAGDDVLDGRSWSGSGPAGISLIGYGGNDTIHGSAAGDYLGGENGNDRIYCGGGDDTVNAGANDDVINGAGGIDRINAGGGDDVMNGGLGDDVLYGAGGNDTYLGGNGTDVAVYTRSFDDIVITRAKSGWSVVEPNGVDRLAGMERIAADNGVFVFDKPSGRWERVSSVPGELLLHPGDNLDGTADADILDLLGSGKTMAFGFDGNDTITGTAGYELLKGGRGDDTIYGESADTGSGALDRLWGEAGDDKLYGRGGNDIIYGGAGSDLIDGGTDSDELSGGAMADTFVFVWDGAAGAERTWGYDLIRDFQLGIDKVHLEFFNLAPGTHTRASLGQTADGAAITLDGAGTILFKGLDATGHSLAEFLI